MGGGLCVRPALDTNEEVEMLLSSLVLLLALTNVFPVHTGKGCCIRTFDKGAFLILENTGRCFDFSANGQLLWYLSTDGKTNCVGVSVAGKAMWPSSDDKTLRKGKCQGVQIGNYDSIGGGRRLKYIEATFLSESILAISTSSAGRYSFFGRGYLLLYDFRKAKIVWMRKSQSQFFTSKSVEVRLEDLALSADERYLAAKVADKIYLYDMSERQN